MKPELKTYLLKMLTAFILYAGVLIGSNLLLRDATFPRWITILIAITPALPLALIIRAVIRFSRSWDELQKQIAMEAMLLSFFITGLGSFAYGFLEGIGFPPLETIWYMPIMITIQGLSQILVGKKYR